MFKKYNKCIFCKSKNFKIEKIKKSKINFYVQSIISDLNLKSKDFKKIRSYKCQNCFILQNNPWFSEEVSQKIYGNIYGQHNRSWSNILNFVNKGIKPNHGDLYEFLQKRIKIKNYAEFKAPFMGLMLNFFSEEYKEDTNFLKKYFNLIIKYLNSRQVVDQPKKIKKLSISKGTKIFKKISNLSKKNCKKKIVNKYLFLKNSDLSWGQNDNYKSVNSISLASEFINDLNLKQLNIKERKFKFDLFGIFHTLDHTFEPKKILDYALNVSKYVIIYCHNDKELNRQHLFSFTKEFVKFLNKNKIYTFELNDLINKDFKSPELYFICSRKKKNIEYLKQFK